MALSDCRNIKFYYAAVQKLFHEAGFDAFCAGFSEFMNTISLVPRPIPCFSMLHAEKLKPGNGPGDEARVRSVF